MRFYDTGRFPLLIAATMLVSGCAVVNKQPATMNSLSSSLEASKEGNDLEAKSDLTVATGRLAEDEGDTNRAMQLYSEAIVMNPDNADAHWRQAILFSRLQQLEESNEAFARAMELDDSNTELRADYGYHLYLQDRFAEAEEVLRTAIRLKPDQQRAHNNLGLVLAATGRNQQAIASFLDAGCSEADAQSNLGFVQALGNDLSRARSSYQKALALDPSLSNSTKALNQLNKLVALGSEPEATEPDVVPASYSIGDRN